MVTTLCPNFIKWTIINYLDHPINRNEDSIDWKINFANGSFPFLATYPIKRDVSPFISHQNSKVILFIWNLPLLSLSLKYFFFSPKLTWCLLVKNYLWGRICIGVVFFYIILKSDIFLGNRFWFLRQTCLKISVWL